MPFYNEQYPNPVRNPLVDSVFNDSWDFGEAPPPPPMQDYIFIEGGDSLLAEGGDKFITE